MSQTSVRNRRSDSALSHFWHVAEVGAKKSCYTIDFPLYEENKKKRWNSYANSRLFTTFAALIARDQSDKVLVLISYKFLFTQE